MLRHFPHLQERLLDLINLTNIMSGVKNRLLVIRRPPFFTEPTIL